MEVQPKVVIVGAGLAGLSAGARLREAGFTDIQVLEASDRVGGRIHTVQFGDGDFPVELGASWIHGATKENCVFDLADQLGILTPYQVDERTCDRYLREDGTEIDNESCVDAWNIFRELYNKSFVDISAKIANGENETNLNIGARYKEYIEKEARNNKTIGLPEDDMRRLFNVFLNGERISEGDELEKVSFESDKDVCLEGGDVHIWRGYNQIIDHLCGKLTHDSITMNTEVTRIKWANVTSDKNVEIFTKTGEKFHADHVIVTCSLGYLKQNHETLFEPKLPSEKVSAINSIGFGRVAKIFLEFDEPIMKPSNESIAFAWDDITLAEDKSNWFRRIFGFDDLHNKENTLLGWISGEAAEHMETLPDDEITDVCVKLLRQFLNDDTVPYPKNILISRWCSNPYTLGVYSHQTPSLIPGEFSRMAEPLLASSGAPAVLFAGEATDLAFYSCTHGARSSGLREAERLIERYAIK